MKLLSNCYKKVKYFGMELIVPQYTKYITVDAYGIVCVYARKPQEGFGSSFMAPLNTKYEMVAVVDLEGMDWRDTLVCI